jgi:transposase-like protein
MIDDSMLLQSSESPPSSSSSTLPLRSLQEILHNRIKQRKGEMHKSHNIAYNDSLWTEIETIHWVLAQILALLRQSQSA